MKRRTVLLSGSAGALAPLLAASQPARKVHRLAILGGGSVADMTEERSPRLKAFFAELRHAGFVEGDNLVVDRRSTTGDTGRILVLASEVIALSPDVIFIVETRFAQALKAVTTTIPIVALTNDPVGAGLALSLARPGGNVTGFSLGDGIEVVAKRIELLLQAAPAVRRIAYMAPRIYLEGRFGAYFRNAAVAAGVVPVDAPLDQPIGESTYRSAFASIAQARADAVSVEGTTESFVHRALITQLAADARLPAIYALREAVEAGGLMAYAVDTPDVFRGCADYVGRILKGATPGELPFQQSTKYELAINIKSAKAFGLVIPTSLLIRADRVVE
ncbi:MAG: ABC transporter substrate-binding protein [Caldimonas sp.]